MPTALRELTGRGLRDGQRRCRRFLRDLRGVVLLETVIAVTVLLTISASTLIAFSATQRARGAVERSATAENVVRNQMEYIFNQKYHSSTAAYTSVTSTPEGYSVVANQEIVSGDSQLQKISVTVSHDGVTLFTVETLRFND